MYYETIKNKACYLTLFFSRYLHMISDWFEDHTWCDSQLILLYYDNSLPLFPSPLKLTMGWILSFSFQFFSSLSCIWWTNRDQFSSPLSVFHLLMLIVLSLHLFPHLKILHKWFQHLFVILWVIIQHRSQQSWISLFLVKLCLTFLLTPWSDEQSAKYLLFLFFVCDCAFSFFIEPSKI